MAHRAITTRMKELVCLYCWEPAADGSPCSGCREAVGELGVCETCGELIEPEALNEDDFCDECEEAMLQEEAIHEEEQHEADKAEMNET